MDTIIAFTRERAIKKYLVDEFDSWEEIWLAASLRLPPSIRGFSNGLPCSYAKIPFNGHGCHVFYNNFVIFEEQKKSWSQTSGALYLGRSADKMDGLLLQYMPANAKTSRHYHTVKQENFHNLLGECLLDIDGHETALEKRSCLVVPRQVHQVKTRNSEALNLLEIIGDVKGISLDDHNYAPE